ncbi:MAG: Uma2 family endonuclease, partial [Actinomycetia bacterium]|nr:Uma2 family endonuclease [Actinomycetes bacterium]
MSAVTTVLGSRPFTRADLDAMPDDGRRHELIDGVLVVTPAPSDRHQIVSMALGLAIAPALPGHLRVLAAPFDVLLAGDSAASGDTVTQPDLIVAPKESIKRRGLPGAPLLAIEILSASTRRFDLIVKRARYEEAGCAHYWVVDPDEPRIIAWELQDGAYVEVADVAGDDELELER